MSSLLVFESWQMAFPAIGFLLFSTIFIGVSIRVWRMKHPRIEHLENLPLEDELPRRARHVSSR